MMCGTLPAQTALKDNLPLFDYAMLHAAYFYREYPGVTSGLTLPGSAMSQFRMDGMELTAFHP